MKTWSKTKTQGLLRHKSGRYYARLYSGDKEKWVSLGTDVYEVAKAKMGSDETVQAVRGKQNASSSSRERLTVGDAIEMYLRRLDTKVALEQTKPGTKKYWSTVIDTIRDRWERHFKTPLEPIPIGKITAAQVKEWAGALRNMKSLRQARVNPESQERLSARYYNNALYALRAVFAEAVEAGEVHVNPAAKLTKARVKKTDLQLPTKRQFRNLVRAVRAGKHRTSRAAGDMLELLAYTGTRVSEARRMKWKDIDFARRQVLIKGDPQTGTKNWEIRYMPMIAPLEKLLRQMKGRCANNVDPEATVLRVKDIRGALARGCDKIGIPTLSHHDLRHLFASIALESRVDVATAARWMGHRDGGALLLRTYAHLRDEHSQALARKVSF